MAKKILSILCALTMLVTMVSVAAFSVSAESTSINLLSSSDSTGWTTVYTSTSVNRYFAGEVDLTSYNISGINNIISLVKNNTSADSQKTYVDFQYGEAIDFGEDFEILFTSFMQVHNFSTAATTDTYVALTLGDYTVRLIRYAEDDSPSGTVVKDASGRRTLIRAALYKGDTLVAKSANVIDKDVTTTMFAGDVVSNLVTDDILAYTAKNCPSGVGKYASALKSGIFHDAGFKDLTVAVKNGTMTIKDAVGTVLLTSDVSDASFDGVTPSIRFNNDHASAKSSPMQVIRLEATINESAAADPAAALEPKGGSLSLNDAVNVNFLYDSTWATDLEAAGYTDITATAKIDGYSDFDMSFTPADLQTVDGYSAFVFTDLNPYLFGNDIELTVSATYQEETVTAKWTYSVKTYCVNKIGDDGEPKKLRDLCYRILEYGAAAQAWSGKGADVGIEAIDYTPTVAAWTAATHSANESDPVAEPAATWTGMRLNVANNVGIKFYFTLDGAIGDYDVVAAGGIETTPSVSVSGEEYVATVRVYAYSMTEKVAIVVKKANEPASSTYNASVEDYINYALAESKFDDAETAVAKTMMNYGLAAAAYKTN